MEQKEQLANFGLFDSRVPRYTSYPTATHFSEDVGAREMGEWIASIPANSDISLYLHVPFCRRLCWFCACRTQGTLSDAPVQIYVEALKRELALVRARLAPGIRVRRLHWGGGTPTLLSPAMITDLAETIFKILPLTEDAEFSVEIDPNEIDSARVDALAKAGMNRASLGVQDFDPQIQKAIGRAQSYEVTAQAMAIVRAAGVRSLNADILYGLPLQTPDGIAQTARRLLELRPDRVALYGYAHVPWMARRQQLIASDALPTPIERLRLFETARAIFCANGLEEIGIDHFAKPEDGLALAARSGRLRRNFQGYTDDQAPVLLALGASAISRFPQGYAQNVASTSDYQVAINAGRLATKRGHVFTPDDRLRARLIEILMCDFAIRSDEILQDFAISRSDLARLLKTAAAPFVPLIHVSDEGLFIPHPARPLTRMIARGFDTYAMAQTAHSHAI